jgi:hypothetical protein
MSGQIQYFGPFFLALLFYFFLYFFLWLKLVS